MTDSQAIDWHKDIFDVLNEQGVSLVAHVPDAGHTPLIKRCEAANDIDVVTLTTEEEGIGLLSGAWAGGRKGVLLMQSSGVGNCANALALPIICRIPFLTIVSMRGEWGEFIPWQVPMGQGTPGVLEAMDVKLFRADYKSEVGMTVDAAAKFAFNTRQSAAVLLSQKMIGAKQFKEG
ncbi:MAG: thiamine pyrophosphate-binding protein [Gammaproteobacteria bacterium]